MNSTLKNIFWCKNCVTMSTRPRITFDSRGYYDFFCQWTEEKEKKSIGQSVRNY